LEAVTALCAVGPWQQEWELGITDVLQRPAIFWQHSRCSSLICGAGVRHADSGNAMITIASAKATNCDALRNIAYSTVTSKLAFQGRVRRQRRHDTRGTWVPRREVTNPPRTSSCVTLAVSDGDTPVLAEISSDCIAASECARQQSDFSAVRSRIGKSNQITFFSFRYQLSEI
jgi:hypothetical protein